MSAIDKVLKLCNISNIENRDDKLVINNNYWESITFEDGHTEIRFFGKLQDKYIDVSIEDMIAVKDGDRISDDLEEDIANIDFYSRAAILTIINSIYDVIND